MVEIRVQEAAGSGDTTEQGLLLWDTMRKALDGNEVIILSFEGITTATSSFVNVSFVRLLDIMSLDDVKCRVRVVKSSRQINEMIKNRLEKEAAPDRAGSKLLAERFVHAS